MSEDLLPGPAGAVDPVHVSRPVCALRAAEELPGSSIIASMRAATAVSSQHIGILYGILEKGLYVREAEQDERGESGEGHRAKYHACTGHNHVGCAE